MCRKLKGTDSEHLLSEDGNRCCSASGGKKRANDGAEKKTRQPKKPRTAPPKSYLQAALLDSLRATSQQQGMHWMDTSDHQDEVVCTPDIIAIDESPPNSPSGPWRAVIPPPPLAPLPPLVRAPTAPSTSKNTIIVVAPSTQENHFSVHAPGPSKGQPLMWHLPEGLKATASNASTSQSPINPQKLSQMLNNKIVIPYIKPTAPKLTVPPPPPPPVTKTVATPPVPPTPIRSYPLAIAPIPPPIPAAALTEVKQDWFDLALVECSEITEYVSTKISSLSAVHGRSYRSTQLMEELHNTLQTYMHVALEKLQKMKTNTRRNFIRDMADRRNASGIVPLARVAVHPKNLPTQSVIPPAPSSLSEKTDEESGDSSVEHTISDDETQLSKTSSKVSSMKATEKRKNNIIITNNIQPEDSLFDMEVTNESDEERSCSRATSVTYSERDQEIIDLIDSSDDEDDELKTKSPVPTFPDNEVEDSNEENEIIKGKTPTKELASADEDQDSSSKVTSTQDEDESAIKIEICENPIKDDGKSEKNDEKISKNETKENTITGQENGAIRNGPKVDENDKSEDNDDALNSPKTPTDEEQTNSKDKSEDEIEEEPMDVEELLSSNVVLRSKQNEKASNFDAEFSKFIDNSGAISDTEELSSSPISEEAADTTENVAKEKTPEPEDEDSLDSRDLDILPELLNKDNGSLSLPPSCGNGDYEDVSNTKVVKNSNSTAAGEPDKNGDLVLDSGILALKQMAENCVTSTIEIQQTTTA